MDAHLPLAYRWFVAHGLTNWQPWYFFTEDQHEYRQEFRLETGGNDIYFFARRKDKDDFAGFLIEGGHITETVTTVHLTWKGGKELPGFPRMRTSPSFIAWLQTIVLPDIAEWMTEEDLADLDQ